MTEILEAEIRKHARTQGMDFIYKISEDIRQLEYLTRSKINLTLPTKTDVENAVTKSFEDIGKIMSYFSLSLEMYRDAVRRVIDKIPPAHKQEEFRDTMLWQAVINAAEQDDVVLITNDGDFYEDRKTPQLATVLKKEVEEKKQNVKIFTNILAFLDDFKTTEQLLEKSVVFEAIVTMLSHDLLLFGIKHNLKIGEFNEEGSSLAAFITERAEDLNIEFKVQFDAQDSTSELGLLLNVKLIEVTGNCYFDPETRTVSELVKSRIQCYADNGQEITGKGMQFIPMSSARLQIGNLTDSFFVRVPIDLL